MNFSIDEPPSNYPIINNFTNFNTVDILMGNVFYSLNKEMAYNYIALHILPY